MSVPGVRHLASNEYRWWAKISTGTSQIRAMAFTTDGTYLVSGDKMGVRMLEVADGRQVGKTLEAKDVRAVAVSRCGRWIAVGESWGKMTVWERDGEAFQQVFSHDSEGHTVTSVDFSPNESPARLVSASGNRIAYIWDIATRENIELKHSYWVVAAKFNPQGDCIATATFRGCVQLWDPHSGTLLFKLDSALTVTPYYNTGLLWSNRGIFIVSNKSVKQIHPSNKPEVPEWAVPDGNYPSIVSPRSGDFVLYSEGREITRFSHGRQQGSKITFPQLDAHSIALSSDGRFLAIGDGDGKLDICEILVPRIKVAPRFSKIQIASSYTPNNDGTDENLLVLLQWLDTPGDTCNLFEQLGLSLYPPQTAILALRAPERSPNHDKGAFQLNASLGPSGEIIERLTPALEVMAKVLDHLITDCAWPPNRIHLFGVGQNGSVAAEATLAWWKKGLVGTKTTSNAEQKPVPLPRPLGSVASMCGPLLSHPTLATPCPTPLLIFSRDSVPKNVSTALSKGFTHIREESMTRSRDEQELVRQFWSDVLRGEMGDGIYEVMTSTAA